jgi:hypothetical protein
VANIPTLLDKIPDEYKPLAALGIGAFVLVFLALFHGACLHGIILRQRRGERRLRLGKPRVIAASLLFGFSVFLMLDLHVVEILIWAFALNRMGLLVHTYDAIYYCANSYTTLGMGKMDVQEHWRIISPIIATSGLFTFAWTTSSLVDVVASNRRLLERLDKEREQEIQKRSALRKKVWNTLKVERAAGKAEKEKTATASVGSSFPKRLRIWREDRKQTAELRRECIAEMKELRRQERLKEAQFEDKAATISPDDKEQE